MLYFEETILELHREEVRRKARQQHLADQVLASRRTNRRSLREMVNRVISAVQPRPAMPDVRATTELRRV